MRYPCGLGDSPAAAAAPSTAKGYVGAADTVGGGRVQWCPSRVCTAHAAGGFIRHYLAAASKSRYATYYRRLAADHRCRYALSAIVFPSIATVKDTAAAGRRRKFFAAHPTRN